MTVYEVINALKDLEDTGRGGLSVCFHDGEWGATAVKTMAVREGFDPAGVLFVLIGAEDEAD